MDQPKPHVEFSNMAGLRMTTEGFHTVEGQRQVSIVHSFPVFCQKHQMRSCNSTYLVFQKITVNARFVSKIPMDFPLEKAAPVFCAGVTVFTPLKENGAHLGGLTVGVMGKDISLEEHSKSLID